MSESLGFYELIARIESEIKLEFVGDAIRWADEHYNNAWTNAMLTFEDALVGSMKRQDHFSAKMEGERYKRTVLGLLKKYKQAHAVDDSKAFMDSLATA